MSLKDLFKSSAEIAREQEKMRRKAIREAEHAGDSVKDKIKELRQDRDKAWVEARDYLRDGQKTAAQRCLQTVQATEIMIGKLDRKYWVFKQYITKMEMAKTDQDFTGALQNLNSVLNVDPEQVSEILSGVEDTLSDQGDVDKIWDKKYEKEMDGITSVDTIPSIEEMMSNLEKEVVADVTSGKVPQGAASPHAASLSKEISEGREKLKDLMNRTK